MPSWFCSSEYIAARIYSSIFSQCCRSGCAASLSAARAQEATLDLCCIIFCQHWRLHKQSNTDSRWQACDLEGWATERNQRTFRGGRHIVRPEPGCRNAGHLWRESLGPTRVQPHRRTLEPRPYRIQFHWESVPLELRVHFSCWNISDYWCRSPGRSKRLDHIGRPNYPGAAQLKLPCNQATGARTFENSVHWDLSRSSWLQWTGNREPEALSRPDPFPCPSSSCCWTEICLAQGQHDMLIFRHPSAKSQPLQRANRLSTCAPPGMRLIFSPPGRFGWTSAGIEHTSIEVGQMYTTWITEPISWEHVWLKIHSLGSMLHKHYSWQDARHLQGRLHSYFVRAICTPAQIQADSASIDRAMTWTLRSLWHFKFSFLSPLLLCSMG